MTSQADKDWEEYQLGQQGTATGSAFNQAGLGDRYVPVQGSKKRHKRNTANKQQITKKPPNTKNIDNSFSPLFAIVTFVSVAFYLYSEAGQDETFTALGAGFAALIAGKLYKPIIFGALLVGALFLLGYLK
ncbi:MAG: hypothetical protein COB26_10270 [Piscirickettsiaceae bacterium]|nr:MAG: hypothetical protein COB26_10270 [Piscirickettsiaceae bacterium]